jgi:hypothetical protein
VAGIEGAMLRQHLFARDVVAEAQHEQVVAVGAGEVWPQGHRAPEGDAGLAAQRL